MDMKELVSSLQPQVAEIRRDIHAHPELAFEEHRTSDIVARYLEDLGLEVHRGLAKTGIVARLQVGNSQRAIGLRADMDALPLDELNSFAHRSTNARCMHACGHDGHTAMLLGAAAALSATRNFDGTVYLIFQPAEEREGGGRVMVEEGLFKRFPMDMVFGLHNWPATRAGHFVVSEGPVMAGTDRLDIKITGRGGHAAMPHQAVDVIVAGSALVQGVQSLVSRNTDPLAAAVVSVTRFHAGFADNILPETAVLGGTVRSLTAEMRDALEAGVRRVCAGIEATYGVRIDLQYERGYPPTINAASAAAICRDVAREVVGNDAVKINQPPSMGAEDFAYMCQEVPGCYVWLGNNSAAGARADAGGGCMLHSPHYDFNDDIIATGIRYWMRLAETALGKR